MCSTVKEFDVCQPSHVTVKVKESCNGKCKIKVKKTPLKKANTDLDLNLIYTASIPDESGITPSLSASGDQLYLCFETFTEENPIRAQLYNNVDGTLQLKQQYSVDYTTYLYPWVWLGLASSDFTKFSVFESDAAIENMNVKVLDQSFNFIERLFVDSRYGFINGGSFSEDGHYLIFSYVISSSATTVSSFIYVLDATDPSLRIVAGPVTIAGMTFDSWPTWFTLTDRQGNDHYYISVTNNQFSPTTQTITAPYFSQIYSVDITTGSISFVTQMPLPQLAELNVYVRKNKREALIAHGGFCSVFQNQLTVYDQNTSAIQSALPNDNAEARVLLFDVENQTLKLVIKEALNCCNRTVIYPPGDGRKYLVGQNVDTYATPGDPATQSPLPQEFYCLADIADGPNGRVFRPQNLPRQDAAGTQMTFSQNGKWYIRTGTYGYNVPPDFNPLPDSYGIHNILLFKVTSAEYKPICDVTPEHEESNKPKQIAKVLPKTEPSQVSNNDKLQINKILVPPMYAKRFFRKVINKK